MTNRYPDALPASRLFLKVLVVLNLLMGLGVLVLLVASLVARRLVMQALAHDPDVSGTLLLGMQSIMVFGLIAVALTHRLLSRLTAIVETVREGDPFVAANAERLNRIAWITVGLQVLHVLIGAVASAVSTPAHPLDINSDFNLTPWLWILLIFVLARVFEEGTRMREELAGTV
jgi:hypothetical protein